MTSRLRFVALATAGIVASLVPSSAGAGAGSITQVACSTAALISAVSSANTNPGADTLQLAPSCTYLLTTSNNNWYGPNGLPPIASHITIEGAGGTTIGRSGSAPAFRLFFVGADPADPDTTDYTTPGAGTLVLRDLTVSGGLAKGGDAQQGGGGAGLGGAIFSQGQVQFENVTATDNEARGGSTVAGGGAGGGGIGTDAGARDGGGFGPGTFGGASGGAGSPAGGGCGGGGGGGFRPQDDGASGALGVGGNGGGPETGLGGRGRAVSGATAGISGNGAGGGSGAAGFNCGPGGAGGDFGQGGTLPSPVNNPGGGGGVGGGGSQEAGGGFGGGAGGSGPNAAHGGFGGGGGGSVSGAGSGGFGAGAGGSAGLTNAGGGGAGMGGAVFNMQGAFTALNSTFEGNRAVGGTSTSSGGLQAPGEPGQGLGGAVFNLNGQASIRFATMAANVADAGGATYNVFYDHAQERGAIVTIENSIAADSINGSEAPIEDVIDHWPALIGAPANLSNEPLGDSETNLPRSLVEDSSTRGSGLIFQDATPLAGDPALGPLSDNGGLTPTMLPAPESPVIDAADNSVALLVDQRGTARPYDVPEAPNFSDGSDVGAVELVLRRCQGETVTVDGLVGTSGDDVIAGTAGDDAIDGGGGDDVICGRAGRDAIAGAAGDDQLRGNKGGDAIDGGRDDDSCFGGVGRDAYVRCETATKP